MNSVHIPYCTVFCRKTDVSHIPFYTVLGVNISTLNMEQLCSFVTDNIEGLSGDYICVTNVHTTVTAYDDPEYQRVQNGSILTVPDGEPIAWIGRRSGFPKLSRCAGPDFMEKILKISAEKRLSHFFYGSTPETLGKMRERLEQKYPEIIIKGMISPPFRELTEKEDADIIEVINKADADFVWVGLGAPKQEIWMAKHQGKIKGLMVGTGAAFDFLAGNIRRAPIWMQKCGLEWLYRLCREPKRLFKRYFYSNIKFIWNAVIRRK